MSPRPGRAAAVVVAVGMVLFVAVTVPVTDSAWWNALVWWIQDQQRVLHRGLTGALRAVRSDGAPAAWALIGLSFVYGVFHAAGPGHGKAVIATYLGTQESRLRRGIVLSVLSALLQGVVAVVLVETAVSLLGLGLRRAEAAGRQVETLSFLLVAVVGLLFALRALRRLWRRVRTPPPPAAPATGLFTRRLAQADADDDVPDDTHGTRWQQFCSDCGRMHGPDRHALEAPLSRRAMAGIVLAIGIRPCTGAILVLLVAHAMDLRASGIAAVAAMSVGTALATSVLAAVTVLARQAALRLLGAMRRTPATIGMVIDVAAVLGGTFIFILGAALLHTSVLGPAHPLF